MTLLLLLGGAGTPPVTSDIDETHVWIYNGSWTEVTNGDVYEVSVNRGRNRELDEIPAGTARIRVRNQTGNYGPFTWGDYGTLTPGTPVVVSYGTSTASLILGIVGTPIFFGFIEDFGYSFAPKRFTDATLICADGLARVARQQMRAWTATAGQTTGDRIAAVLARPEVGSTWLFGDDIDDGLSVLQGDTINDGTNVLSYLQLVNRSEQGRLFATREDILRFQDRQTVGTPGASVVDFRDNATGQVAGLIPFTAVEVSYGAELFYNYVAVDNTGGTVQTASSGDADRHLTLSGLLMDSDAQANDLTDYLLARYDTPTPIVSGIRVALERLSAANRETVAGIELGDAVDLHWTPWGQSAVAETYVVEGIAYSKSLTSPTEMFFQLSAAPTNDFFILDTSVLDTDAVGF